MLCLQIKIYEEDDDNLRKEEMAALGAPSTTAVYSKFYDRLKEIRDYHKRFPVMDITEGEDDSDMLKEEPHVEFSGEEGKGR